MRLLNISNDKKRNAEVGFETIIPKPIINFTLKDGSQKKNIKYLKGSQKFNEKNLMENYENLRDLGEKIIEEDLEVDLENAGKILSNSSKLYVNQKEEIIYRVNLFEIIKNIDGTERERKEFSKTKSNILGEIPLQWTGKKVPKEMAIRKFVFSKKYQVKHVNGLTYDFLFDMAKNLYETKTMMLVGAGKNGAEPIVLMQGGTPYRGFMEGRIKDDKYCLILHLTNLELKEIK